MKHRRPPLDDECGLICIILKGHYVVPGSFGLGSADSIRRFMMLPGNGKYMDSGYDGMKKDGYRLADVRLKVVGIKEI
jgi:hypothetical protein